MTSKPVVVVVEEANAEEHVETNYLLIKVSNLI